MPYAEIRQLEPPQRVAMENGRTPPPTGTSLEGAGQRQLCSLSQDNYDFLKPTLPSRRSSSHTPSHHHHHHHHRHNHHNHSPLKSTNSSSHFSSHFSSQHSNSNIRGGGGGSFSHMMAAAASTANQPGNLKTRSSKSPSRSPQGSLKPPQSFPTRTELVSSMEGVEDMDTYVYMARAPLNDIPDGEGAAAKHTPTQAATGGTRSRVTIENPDTDLESGSEVRYSTGIRVQLPSQSPCMFEELTS